MPSTISRQAVKRLTTPIWPKRPEPTPEERRAAQEVAAGDDGKMHLGKNFGEALVDILVPGAGSHTGDFARPTDPAAPTVVTPITSDTDKK